MPHISVMLPTYNLAHLVGQTIESVLAQEFQDWDLVVVDDASQDDTIEVVSRYCRGDSRIRLLANEKNLGLTRNWNHCLELATGPLVQILQSDDLIDPDYLRLVSQVFEEHPQLGFVAASCRYIDAGGRISHAGNPRSPRLYRAGDEAVTALLTGGWPHVSSIVMRRECYERLGPFNEEIWHGPDGEMFTRLASQYDIYHFGEVHTSFRRHGSNMGVLKMLKGGYLEMDMHKKRLTWSYLSPEGRRRLGIQDLDKYIAEQGARTALQGAAVAVAYGRYAVGREYFRQALKLDPHTWRDLQCWKSLALVVAPSIGKRIMQSRIGIKDVDRRTVEIVESSPEAGGDAGG